MVARCDDVILTINRARAEPPKKSNSDRPACMACISHSARPRPLIGTPSNNSSSNTIYCLASYR